MPDKWDRVGGAIQRGMRDLPTRSIRIYNYTQQYDSATGDQEWTESELAASPVDARLNQKSGDNIDIDAQGQSAEPEIQISLPGDVVARSDLTSGAADTGRPTVLEDTQTGARYRLNRVDDRAVGRLVCYVTRE
jgi:hypothetical protein